MVAQLPTFAARSLVMVKRRCPASKVFGRYVSLRRRVYRLIGLMGAPDGDAELDGHAEPGGDGLEERRVRRDARPQGDVNGMTESLSLFVSGRGHT